MDALGVIDYKSTENVIQFISRLLSGTFKIIIHINGFEPDRREDIYIRRFKELIGSKIIISKSFENLGFAGGCNKIIDKYLEQNNTLGFLALCNDDLDLTIDQSSYFFDMAKKYRISTMMGTKILSESEQILHTTYSLNKVLFIPNRFHKIIPHHKSAEEFIEEAELVHGSFMIFNREFLEVLKKSRGFVFDERFFAYREESELQYFIRNVLKLPIYYLNTKGIIHIGSVSTGGKNNAIVMYFLNRNSLLLSKIAHNYFAHYVYFTYHIIIYGIYTVLSFKKNYFTSFIDGICDHLNNKYGKIKR